MVLLMQVVLAGPHANSSEHLLGNYYGATSAPVTTPWQAFQVHQFMPPLSDSVPAL